MSEINLAGLFDGCSFSKTDGFRYITCAQDNKTVLSHMEGIGLRPNEKENGQLEFQLSESQISLQNPLAQSIWDFAVEKTEDIGL